MSHSITVWLNLKYSRSNGFTLRNSFTFFSENFISPIPPKKKSLPKGRLQSQMKHNINSMYQTKDSVTHWFASPIFVAMALRSIFKRNQCCVVCYTHRFISQWPLRHKLLMQIGVCKRSLKGLKSLLYSAKYRKLKSAHTMQRTVCHSHA